MPHKIVAILIFVFLASCSSKVGNKSTIKIYEAQIPQGTKLSQITQKYGEYSDSWETGNGNKIYQYSYTKNSYDLVSQLPIINHFGWITSRNVEVILMFDENEKLLEKNGFLGKAKARNSLVCNPKIYSCVRKVHEPN
jgi:hypothetical protein